LLINKKNLNTLKKLFFSCVFRIKKHYYLIKNKMTKFTLNGTKLKVIKISGFLARMSTKSGQKILKNRRKKGRWKL
jgi:large subunit ribosomal protein L34